MSSPTYYRVKQVASLTGVTVRALHHYDEIGLLSPARRSEAGYRLYSADDLLRLQQILVGRALGMSLEDIRRMLDDPAYDRRRALLDQRAELQQRLQDTTAMLAAIDAALKTLDGDPVDMKTLFDGFDPAAHDAEAQSRWGDTEAYAESQRRTSRHRADDWAAMKREADAIYDDMATLLRDGAAPTDERARAVAARHRAHIERWFYPCPAAMHVGLAELYEADERFAETIDAHAEGLTPFFAAAIRAHADTIPEA